MASKQKNERSELVQATAYGAVKYKEIIMNKALFTSISDNWSTPKDICENYIFNGYYDPCVLDENYIDNLFWYLWPEQPLFINPPYSNVKEWVYHAIQFNKNKNKEVVLLVASRTDTIWFHWLLKMENVTFEFIKGRLKFGDSNKSAPFPSVLITIHTKE